MRFEYAPHFQRQIRKLPPDIRRIFMKQVAHLLRDLRHPSLRAKKHDETRGVWQARVNNHYRFYFQIREDHYTLLSIKKHTD